jgi:hypothetical protein
MNSRPRMEDFADHVEHPRYGRLPRFTGLDPNPDAPEVHLHWNTGCLMTARVRAAKTMGKVDDPPNGGPAMGGGNSGVKEGPPSVG